MNKQDFEQFTLVWRSSVELTGKSISDTALGLAFSVLKIYDIEAIKSALSAHLMDSEKGRFQPKPADIVYQIEQNQKNDGRPDANEAWGIALQSFDDNKTVVMNDEIAGALEFASAIYRDGDKTGARMAFKESYERTVANARAEHKPLKWWVSAGFDVSARRSVIESAVAIGRLTVKQANVILPEPITEEGRKLLTATASAMSGDISALAEMKEALK